MLSRTLGWNIRLQTEFSTGEYISPALGLSLLNRTGVYLDISAVAYAVCRTIMME